jgi:hypothetical protein
MEREYPDDFGKGHVYHCECGGECHRPIWAKPPKPCDHCGAILDGKPFAVIDNRRDIEERINRARGAH